jgi:hypothetical protein
MAAGFEEPEGVREPITARMPSFTRERDGGRNRLSRLSSHV